jgi:hypothetical protein
MNFTKKNTMIVIAIIAEFTIMISYPLIFKNSEVTWIVKTSSIKYSSQTSDDLSNELNTVGNDLQYSYRSNQTLILNNKTNVLLISIDGFSRTRFNQYKTNLTTISNLVKQDWAQFNVTNFAYFTQTKNGHTTMLSGYLGSDTGIYGNHVYDPLPVGYTFLEKAEEESGTNKIATAFISGKYKNIYPAFNESMLIELDYVHIKEQNPEETGDYCIDFLRQYGQSHFAAFLHFRDPDKSGHLYGEGSREWRDSLIVVDDQIGRIFSKLNELGILDRTVIYITSDHGFEILGTDHLHEPSIWLLTNDNKTLVNIDNPLIGLQDITPTICYLLDLPYDYSYIQNGQPLQIEYSQEKIAFREKYLKDNAAPSVDIIKIEDKTTYFEVKLQVSNDVIKLYLFDVLGRQRLDGKKIPLNTTSVILKIDKVYVDKYKVFHLRVYDLAENDSSTLIMTN